MTDDAVRQQLDALLGEEQPHAERIAIAVGLLSEAFRRRGLQATVVGGSTLELHAPGVYATLDIDLVVEGASRAIAASTLETLGFEVRGGTGCAASCSSTWSATRAGFGRGAGPPRAEGPGSSPRSRASRSHNGLKWWSNGEYGAQAIELMVAELIGRDVRLSGSGVQGRDD